MQKRKYKQGMDGMNLEYQLNLEGMEKLYLEPEELKNEAQNTIVKIDCVGGKVRAYVNAVHAIRPNNVTPLGIADKGRCKDLCSNKWSYVFFVCSSIWGYTLFILGGKRNA